ncbi:MAG: hypothetical protein H0T50_14215 [Gemmatimonadales bacterium]|nr:hypothetical protein [Gemmatimonadales bacterium]
MAPFGAFQAGWVSEHYGARVAFALGGVACLLVAAAVGWAMRDRMRVSPDAHSHARTDPSLRSG